jgi:hypothetical protein
VKLTLPSAPCQKRVASVDWPTREDDGPVGIAVWELDDVIGGRGAGRRESSRWQHFADDGDGLVAGEVHPQAGRSPSSRRAQDR